MTRGRRGHVVYEGGSIPRSHFTISVRASPVTSVSLKITRKPQDLLGRRVACRCPATDAYLFYRSGRHKISLVAHDCSGLRFPRVKRIEAHGRKFDVTTLKGYSIVHWEDHELGRSVVSDMDEQLLLELLSGALLISA